jgi:molybdopterin-guanine dinucleotide biosynthesis protein A
MPADVIAIVPAGGRSRRLAGATPPGGKAALELDGESLLGRVCRTLAAETARVIVVAAAGPPLPPLAAGVEVIRDTRPGAGPLAAIDDGLRHARAVHQAALIAVIASCDLPAVHPAVVRLLIARARQPGVSWAVPYVAGHPQVLLSAMDMSLHARLSDAVAAGLASPRVVLAAIAASDPAAVHQVSEAELSAIEPSLASFADVDTPADLARLQATWTRSDSLPEPPPLPDSPS